MNDFVYDISHLLESEPVTAVAPDSRIAKTPPPAPAAPSVADVQDSMARELLQAAEAHDALIQQYLRMTDDNYRDTYGQ
jgi:hypothetical protein